MAAAAIARRRGWMALVTTSNQVRQISEQAKSNVNGKRAFLVETLGVARRLEAQGVPPNQAEAITSTITEVINNSLENVSQSVVTNVQMQMEQYFSLLQRETEKLKADFEKMRSEHRYEFVKVTVRERSDLNLEKWRLRDELAKQCSETSDLTNKFDRKIHSLKLKVQLEAAKYDAIKYIIGTTTLVSISAVGLAVLRILM